MREVIHTDDAPQAIGPYSQAIRAGGMVFVSGQIPYDGQGNLIGGDDVAAQAAQVMKNLEAVLTAAGAGWPNVVRTTIFLQSMDDFQAVNEVYGKAVGEKPPARACVEVSRLPKDVLVEIDAIAVV